MVDSADSVNDCLLVCICSGDKAFCSVECRYRQIFMDEEESSEKSGCTIEYPCSLAAASSPSPSSSSSSSSRSGKGARTGANAFAYWRLVFFFPFLPLVDIVYGFGALLFWALFRCSQEWCRGLLCHLMLAHGFLVFLRFLFFPFCWRRNWGIYYLFSTEVARVFLEVRF